MNFKILIKIVIIEFQSDNIRFLAPKEEVMSVFGKISSEITSTMKIMEALVPNMSQSDAQKLGDVIERELKQMDIDIEEAAQRIQVGFQRFILEFNNLF